jgi:hypothetical protein
MLAGSIPVRRFSPNSLPGLHQCEAEAAETDLAWATYRLAMDGIEETKAGNRPVSAFRATFLWHRLLRTMHRGADTGRAWACARVNFTDLAALAAGPDSQRGCGGDRLGARPLIRVYVGAHR